MQARNKERNWVNMGLNPQQPSGLVPTRHGPNLSPSTGPSSAQQKMATSAKRYKRMKPFFYPLINQHIFYETGGSDPTSSYIVIKGEKSICRVGNLKNYTNVSSHSIRVYHRSISFLTYGQFWNTLSQSSKIGQQAKKKEQRVALEHLIFELKMRHWF